MNEDSSAGPSPLTWDIGNAINRELYTILRILGHMLINVTSFRGNQTSVTKIILIA